MRSAVADLEQDAFRRDRRFVVRLILVMVVGLIGGVWMFAGLTGETVAGCAARAFGAVTETPAAE